MKYSFKRVGSPTKLRDLLCKDSSLQREFRHMRQGLLEEIADARVEGATRVRASLYVDHIGAHSCVTVLS